MKIFNYASYALLILYGLAWGAWFLGVPIDWGMTNDYGNPIVLEVGILVPSIPLGIGYFWNKIPNFVQQYGKWILFGTGAFLLVYLTQWGLNTWVGRDTLAQRWVNATVGGVLLMIIARWWKAYERRKD